MMPLNMAALLTPYAMPNPTGAVAGAGAALQGLGDFNERKREFDLQQAQQAQQFERSKELEAQRLYWDTFSQDRNFQQGLADKETAAVQQGLAAAAQDPEKFDALVAPMLGAAGIGIRQAPPPPEELPPQGPSGIDQIAAIEAGRDEGMQAPPATPPAARTAPQPSPAPPPLTGGLMGYLQQQYGQPEAAPLQEPTTPSAAQPERSAPSAGGTELYSQRTGRSMGSFDPQKLKEIDARRTAPVAEAAGNVVPMADREWVRSMLSAAVESGAVRTPEQFQKLWDTVVQKELQRHSYERASAMSAAARSVRTDTGAERRDISSFKDGNELAREPLHKDPGTTKEVALYPQLRGIADMLEKGQSGKDTALAYRSVAKMVNSGALTDRDAVAPDMFMSWAGKAKRWLTTGFTGDLSPDEKADLVATLRLKEQSILSTAENAYRNAIDAAEVMPDSTEAKQGYLHGMRKDYSQFPFWNEGEVRKALGSLSESPARGGAARSGGSASFTRRGSPAAMELSGGPSQPPHPDDDALIQKAVSP